MSPLTEIRPATPQEIAELKKQDQELKKKKEEELKDIEATFRETGFVALEFRGEREVITEEIEGMKTTILEHFSHHWLVDSLAFSSEVGDFKGTLILRDKK